MEPATRNQLVLPNGDGNHSGWTARSGSIMVRIMAGKPETTEILPEKVVAAGRHKRYLCPGAHARVRLQKLNLFVSVGGDVKHRSGAECLSCKTSGGARSHDKSE